MGVDARLAIKFDQEPTPEELKTLQYNLLRLFDNDLFFWSYKKEDKREDFVTKIEEGEYYFDAEFNATGMWDINLTCRYYGFGYERGPGMEIACILYFLNLQHNIIEIRYGGDSSGTEGEVYDKQKSLQLLEHYLTQGHESYQRFFSHHANPPDCSFCHQPMIEYGWGGGKTLFECQGCGEKQEVR